MSGRAKNAAKPVVRSILRPLLVRLKDMQEHLARLQQQVDQQGQALGQMAPQTAAARELAFRLTSEMDTLTSRVATAQKVFDDVLDAVATQNAVARQSRRDVDLERRDREENVRQIWQTQSDFAAAIERIESRVEFVRREVMLEIQAEKGEDPGNLVTTDPKIVNSDKLAVRPLRINLGCGHIPLDGYVNIDGRELPGVDVVAEVGELPFEPDTLDEIWSAHLLEHFPPTRLRKLLPYWYDLLKAEGRFVAIVPDAESMIQRYAAGELPWEDLKEVTFGGQEYAGDFHFSMYSHDEIVGLLQSVGFQDVELVDTARRNGLSLEMEVHARKPSG